MLLFQLIRINWNKWLVFAWNQHFLYSIASQENDFYLNWTKVLFVLALAIQIELIVKFTSNYYCCRQILHIHQLTAFFIWCHFIRFSCVDTRKKMVLGGVWLGFWGSSREKVESNCWKKGSRRAVGAVNVLLFTFIGAANLSKQPKSIISRINSNSFLLSVIFNKSSFSKKK